MKVLFLTLFETGARYHATMLELLHDHSEAGDQCFVADCDSQLVQCDYNPTKNKLHCMSCKTQTRRAYKVYPEGAQKFHYSKYYSQRDFNEVGKLYDRLVSEGEFNSKYEREGFDWGAAVFSSVVTRTRDIEPDIFATKYADISRGIAISSLVLYRVSLAIIDEIQPEKVYLFNGRHSCLRSFLRAAQYRNIAYAVTEGGHDVNSYGVFENSTPHDIKGRHVEMMRMWEENPNLLREKGAIFYEKRMAGRISEISMGLDFTKGMAKGTLPNGFNEKQHNVAIFCSSEDEYVSVGEQWQISLYKSQIAAIEAICLNAKEDIKVYVRMHPNLKGINNDFVKSVLALEADSVCIIDPASNVDTYSLVQAVDTVVSFGSTVGIEAVWLNKPSILLGSSFYMYLDCCYLPQSHEDVMNLVHQKLEPKDTEKALIYAGYMMTFGRDYKRTRIGDGHADLCFNGVYLNGSFLHRKLLRFYRSFVNHTKNSIDSAQKKLKQK